MSIYALFAASDGKSRIAALQIVGSGPALDAPLPCAGWRPFQCDPGVVQSAHPTPLAGMTVILDGCMEIGVGGGDMRNVKMVKGDMLLVLDTRGEGHSTAITGQQRLRVTGVTFTARDWPAIRAAFSGWPDDLIAP